MFKMIISSTWDKWLILFKLSRYESDNTAPSLSIQSLISNHNVATRTTSLVIWKKEKKKKKSDDTFLGKLSHVKAWHSEERHCKNKESWQKTPHNDPAHIIWSGVWYSLLGHQVYISVVTNNQFLFQSQDDLPLQDMMHTDVVFTMEPWKRVKVWICYDITWSWQSVL